MREIVFEDGRRELIDDSKSNALFEGATSNTFKYDNDKLIKLMHLEERNNLSSDRVKMLKRLMELQDRNVYEIFEFFKSDYGDKMLYNGYVMKEYDHYHNDVTPLGRNSFNIMNLPIEYTINYYVVLYELIRRLTENHFYIEDLHRHNIIKTKNRIILIDADQYSNYKNGFAYENNYSQMRMCFGELIASSLYLTYEVGAQRNEIDDDYFNIYKQFVEELISYEKFDVNKMFEFLDRIKDYNNLSEYFEERYSLVKRRK